MTNTETKPYTIEVVFKDKTIKNIKCKGELEKSGTYFVNFYDTETGENWSIARDEIFALKTYY